MQYARAWKYFFKRFFSPRIRVSILKFMHRNSRKHDPFRLTLVPHNAENQVWISFSVRVRVQTHVMMGVGDVQAVQHSTLNIQLVMAHIIMAYIVMAYIVTAYIVAYIVMAVRRGAQHSSAQLDQKKIFRPDFLAF